KLIVTENTLQTRKPAASEIDRSGGLVFTLSPDYPASDAHKPRWYLSGNPLYGQVKLDIVSTAPMNKAGTEYFYPKIISSLMQLISNMIYEACFGRSSRIMTCGIPSWDL